MKKFLSFALILVFILSAFALVSCKEKDGGENGTEAPVANTKTLTILGHNFSVSNALSEMMLTENEAGYTAVYADNATGAKVVITGAVLQGISDDDMQEAYPHNVEAAKRATAVSAMYTYDNYVFDTTSYGVKFSYKVDKGLEEITYNTAYYYINGNTVIIFAFEETDASRPCGENFAVLAS